MMRSLLCFLFLVTGLFAQTPWGAGAIKPSGATTALNLNDYFNQRRFDVRHYGAKPDNLTFDQTAAFHRAIAAAAVEGGTVVVPPGVYPVNILLDVNGVNFEFSSWQSQSTTTQNYLVPWDITKPCFQIGNNTKFLNGFYIKNLTMHGIGPNGTGEIGMLMPGGVNMAHFTSLSIRRFAKRQLSIRSDGAYCSEYVYFDGLNLEGCGTATPGEGVLHLHYGGEVSGSWVTAIYINNFTIRSNDGEPAIYTEGVMPCFTNGWIQCGMGTANSVGGIVLVPRVTASYGTYTPSIQGWNVQFENAGISGFALNDVRKKTVDNQIGNSRILGSWLKGDWSFNGGCEMKSLDGTLTVIGGQKLHLPSPNLVSARTYGSHWFSDPATPSTTNAQIYQSSGNFLLENTTAGASINLRGGGYVDIYANTGRVAQFNFSSTGGQYLKFVNATTGNSPSIAAEGSDTNITLALAGKGTGDVAVTTGNLAINTLGKGLKVKTGTNAKAGTAVLVAGTVTVANTSVTANSIIMLTSQVNGGTPGFLRVTAKTAGTSFVITSSSGTDTSTVAWHIIELIP